MHRSLKILILGPFFYLKPEWRKGLGLFLLIITLTLVTQIGGLVLWLSLPLLVRINTPRKFVRRGLQTLVFLMFYLLTLFLIVPPLASQGGRVPLPCFVTAESPLKPANLGFCLLARNYVRPTVRQVLTRIAGRVAERYPGTRVMYLDGNFPFLNGFPLLPHLSHKDGKKLDLAYFYRNSQSKESLRKTPSPIGYWAYEQPQSHETQPCKWQVGWLRWDFEWLQPLFASVEVDPERTGQLLQELIAAPEVQKVLIEPHLKRRLHAHDAKVRFQGCHAARHDDHIHFQIH
jgi:hypothetical protein